MRMLVAANVVEMFRDFLLPFGNHFRNRGWRVDALGYGVAGSSECRSAFDTVFDIEWSRNPLDPANWLHAGKTVTGVVEGGGYDIVHVHTPIAAFVTRSSLRSHRKSFMKVIYTAHGFHFHPGGALAKNLLFRSMEKLAGRWTDRLIVINRQDEHAALEHKLVPRHKLIYMPGIGIDLQYYHPSSVQPSDIARVRADLGLSPDEKFLLMVAEFTPGKRHRDALHAFARVASSSAKLVFAGEGPLLESSRLLAEQLGIGPRVSFLGYRKDIPALMCASEATVLPSEREGLPRAIMESLALEVPVIATDVRGCRDLLSDGGGVLVKVGDHNALANAMNSVLEDRRAAVTMARAGRERLRSHDIGNVLKLHENVYEDCLRAGA